MGSRATGHPVVLTCRCGHRIETHSDPKRLKLPVGSFSLGWGSYSITCPGCGHQGQVKLHEAKCTTTTASRRKNPYSRGTGSDAHSAASR
jgi:hypothetical protein